MKSSTGICLWLVLSLIILFMSGGCAVKPSDAPASFKRTFEPLVKPYTFNYALWELKTLYHEIKPERPKNKNADRINAAAAVNYFSAGPSSQDPALKDGVEDLLSRQISQVLADEGIYNPFVNWHFTFPPVKFVLEKPPYILIVSPRGKIERLRDVTLKQDITLKQVETLEYEIDQLDVSALVIPIGGMGATYPSFVEENMDLMYTLKTACEEWLHQYLVFKPLGFHYLLDLLGIKPDAEIDSLNETVAGVAAEETGNLVWARYYAQYPRKQGNPGDPAGFDFNAAMRETRRTVDSLLASGQILQAESYMEDRRRFINSHGYGIRKLNQAYFAFYGTYTYDPTSIDPLGDQVRSLRQQSPSLRAFLQTVSGLTSRKEFTDMLITGS